MQSSHAIRNYILIMVLFCTMSASASLQSREAGHLELRTGQHTAFLRIVMEGTESIISKATVTQKGKNILVKFPGAVFTVNGKRAKITYKKEEDTIMLSPKNFGKYRSFSLKNPDRLVIDIYGTPLPEKNLQTEKKMPVKKTPPVIKPKESNPMVKAPEKQGQTRKSETTATTPDQVNNDNMFTTGQYEKFQDLLKSIPPSSALKKLSAYKLTDIESLAKYHFLYGSIYDAKKEYLSAIKHFTLAVQHADNDELKERALLKKAGLYLKLGFSYEAKSNYNIFINNFPSSGHIKEAHLGMAKSLSEIGSFNKAIEHYKKADSGAETFFGIANTLQRLGKVNEANAAYSKAFLTDNSYPERSPETYYLIGENKRMTGKTAEAKRLLKAIRSGPFRDNANISLGLIAIKETDINNAMKYFKSASVSKDRKLRMEALINLSAVFSKSGEIKKAVSILEEIRHNYLHSTLYNKSTFDLSKAYREDGRIKDSLTLLKELAYSKSSPKEVFNELEEILLEASAKTEKDIPEDLKFSAMWNDFGRWLLDGSREEFLVKMIEPLKQEGGRPFLNLSKWLIENASKETKARAAADMADFYITMGDPETSKKSLTSIKLSPTGSPLIFKDSKPNKLSPATIIKSSCTACVSITY